MISEIMNVKDRALNIAERDFDMAVAEVQMNSDESKRED